MKFVRYAVIALIFSVAAACGASHMPPNLTPQAQTAFNKTKAIKTLDLVRDIAIDANAQSSALMTVDDTRKVVTFHQSSLKIIQASDAGWSQIVVTSLQELLKNLPPSERDLLSPYVNLAIATLKSIR